MALEGRKPGPKGSKSFYRSYWNTLDGVVKRETSLPGRDERFTEEYYTIYPLARKGLHVAAVINPAHCDVPMRVEFSLVRKELGDAFNSCVDLVQGLRDEIEDRLGPGLDWRSTTDNQFQIGKNFMDWDLHDKTRWAQQHRFLAAELDRFHRALTDLLPRAE